MGTRYDPLLEDMRSAFEVQRILSKLPPRVQRVHAQSLAPQEEPDLSPVESTDAMRVFLKTQKQQPPRRVPLSTLGLTPEEIQEHNSELITLGVHTIMMVGSRATSSMAAAEAGTTVVFRATFYGMETPPAELVDACVTKSRLMGEQQDVFPRQYGSGVTRVSPEEVAYVRGTVHVTVDDLSSL